MEYLKQGNHITQLTKHHYLLHATLTAALQTQGQLVSLHQKA